MTTLTLKRPDDWHLHLRDGEVLAKVLPYTARHFARAIVMPNLAPPVVTAADARGYRQRIEAACPAELDFTPLMTIYMTETTDAQDLRQGFARGDFVAAKLYPAGATTNSDAGVRDIEKIYPLLEVMAEIGMPLLVHGEVVDPEIDIFDREAVFIDTKLMPVRDRFPQLRIVFEHLTTADGVSFVQSCENNVAATITPHHLVINRNAMLVGGIHPHYYCLPVAKRESHRQALRRAATSGDSRFFLGTDSAPHLKSAKESACGCAGIFNVANTLSVLAHVFEAEQALDKLEGFTSLHGPMFYGMPVNSDTIALEKQEQPLEPEAAVEVFGETIEIFDPQFPLHWRVSTGS